MKGETLSPISHTYIHTLTKTTLDICMNDSYITKVVVMTKE